MASGRLYPCRVRNVGQRLQQTVDQHAAGTRLVALGAAAGEGARRRRLVVGARRRNEPRRRCLGPQVAVEPGWPCIGRRRGDALGHACARRAAPCDSARPCPLRRRPAPRSDPGGCNAANTIFHQQSSGGALAFRTADDEAVDGARHRHVEQPPVFFQGLAAQALARGAEQGCIGRSRHDPRQAVRRMRRAIGRERDQARLALRRPCRLGRRVGENDDRGLQALGTVHRHHPHLVARDLHVALHIGTRRAQPSNEALQRRVSRRSYPSARLRNSSSASSAS